MRVAGSLIEEGTGGVAKHAGAISPKRRAQVPPPWEGGVAEQGGG